MFVQPPSSVTYKSYEDKTGICSNSHLVNYLCPIGIQYLLNYSINKLINLKSNLVMSETWQRAVPKSLPLKQQ